MFRVGLDGNHSAMVHTAGQNVVVSAHGIGSCVHAGAGHDEHARFFGRAGDDGVGGKGGAQVDGAHGGGVAFLQDDAQRYILSSYSTGQILDSGGLFGMLVGLIMSKLIRIMGLYIFSTVLIIAVDRKSVV